MIISKYLFYILILLRFMYIMNNDNIEEKLGVNCDWTWSMYGIFFILLFYTVFASQIMLGYGKTNSL